jgi:hypothetical protein
MRPVAEFIVQVCEETHVPMALSTFGQAGVDAIFDLMVAIKKFYHSIEPERIQGEIRIIRFVDQNRPPDFNYGNVPILDPASLANHSIQDLNLELRIDGKLYVVDTKTSIQEIAQFGIVYKYKAAIEEFFAKTISHQVMRLDPSSLSQFSVPTLSDLRDALRMYARENVLESTCPIFSKSWLDGTTRLFFKAGRPEDDMRDSLLQFLNNRIGSDHDVWPEQKVNTRNPVDIRVQPKFANNRLMLIEIKWLGKSSQPDDHITARHGIPRALEGAEQLANYLDEQRASAPGRVIHGYYVIIDGRRKNLRGGETTISKSDGLFYESEEIAFSPEYHKVRQDFDPPYRMFARPKV